VPEGTFQLQAAISTALSTFNIQHSTFNWSSQMPRNPDKTRCAIPGCRNWAMRDRARCRAHRDAELGPRGAGAPPGNLNALRHGVYARPLPAPDFERLVAEVIEQPDDLPLRIALAIRAIQARTGDLFLTLIALRTLLSHLTNRVAGHLFSAELQAALRASLSNNSRRSQDGMLAPLGVLGGQL
jgi:hypothetical protein